MGTIHPSRQGFTTTHTHHPPQYIDPGLVSAIQRFDLTCWENENGIFTIFGLDWLKFTVVGPFMWPNPSKRTICAFQPTRSVIELGGASGLKWEVPMEPEASVPFEEASMKLKSFRRDVPFFKFIFVDQEVAVAQGRSGGVAVWARIE